ncbi:ScbR family autoregulator-binding transcription factor [Streptomyces sp. WI04-05B]|uniref:ScbR family autoregulator-binding transcription factor n=1 Tax=Streptomyces TaxID=1883 RepID=UPI0029B9C885|nr:MULTISPECIES: ScbR family autoregulator-binding transcription factor [unclassified Streptomyces]MDX2542444.1 ScbR family autoregulator-binding transcription factor [Streptomyces sp. WI04-05B]MDX2582537.1 ScbR family autoregulator-binding transcription factor [Streptomyces sp. WI04-05A]MDX3747949.1 ScbR family autoregulator-binding transcription factor [Streptomyces sp. AK08-02]
MRQLKQQRAVETREAILHAAAAVFDECGYAGASINRILERAGATSGALYFHFTSKDGLARAVMQAQPRTIMPLLTSEGLQRLVDITMIWSHLLQTDTLLRAGVRLTTEQSAFGMEGAATPYQEWAAIMEECLVTAAERGELQAGVDPKELAELVVETCTGMQLFSAAATGRADLPQRAVRMWKLVLPGVAVPALAVRIVIDPEQGRAAVYGSLPAAGSMT